MLLSSFRRRRSWLRTSLILLISLVSLDLLFISLTIPGPATKPTQSNVVSGSPTAPAEQIFIAAMLWHSEYILWLHWHAALLDLARALGPENIYVSIIGGGHKDDTRGALERLRVDLVQLGVGNTFVWDNNTHADDMVRTPGPDEKGWIYTKRGKKELRRIPFLANIRNRVMEPLRALADAKTPRRFEKVLWINDVIFNTQDITTLLNTRDGSYAAACSLDFQNPPSYYDTFVLRDIEGLKPISKTYPFFISPASRNALIHNLPVPVQSCWNGIVAFQASPFYGPSPLKFRGIDDSLAAYHLEGSECCLIHSDNKLSSEYGVWLNPNVRVGYNTSSYEAVNPKDGRDWLSSVEKVAGIWKNHWAGITGSAGQKMKNKYIHETVKKWTRKGDKEGGKRRELGEHCLIDEMQVLIENGWAHV